MKTLIRLPYVRFDLDRFNALVEKMMYTTYKVGAKYEEAPQQSDCVSAMRYILEYSTDIILPRVYIGDMPKVLIES